MSAIAPTPRPPAGAPRSLLTAAITAPLGLVLAHAIAAPLRGDADPASWSLPLSVASLVVSCAAVALARRGAGWPLSLALGSLSWLSVGALIARFGPTLSLVPAALLTYALARHLLLRLPARVETEVARHPIGARVWLVLAVVAVVQLARLATWINDPGSSWFLATAHPFWAKHECMSAYLYGGELALRGEENVYDAAHYPGLVPDAQPATEVAHMIVEDPYQYAPQFLLWPAAALALSHDYPSLRAAWFALQVMGFMGVVIGLGLWLGGRAGRISLWLAPLALSAFPALHDLQYGQFHLAAVALALVAMIAFDRGRHRLGGALLATATLSKLFPGVLLLVLVAQRRYRALAWTAAFAGVLTAATVAVFGAAPFVAFRDYHLARLQSGAAFAFGEAWPEVYDMVLVANQGVYGLVRKLDAIGLVTASNELAIWINRCYAVLLAGFTLAAGARIGALDRAGRASCWLALLGLASLMSTGAFADYVPVTATWLLTLLVARVRRGPARVALVAIWVSQYTLLGTTPIGDWFDPRVLYPASVLSGVALLGTFLWALGSGLRQVGREPARDSASPGALRAAES